MSNKIFQTALEKLVGDEHYRRKVAIDGSTLTNDFALTDDELKALKLAGQRTGWIDEGAEALEDLCCCCCCCP